jgi:transposase
MRRIKPIAMARLVLADVRVLHPGLQQLWADTGYQGRASRAWVERQDWRLELVRRPRRWMRVPQDVEPPPRPADFQVLPRRWVVERTFAWLGRSRRLSKDYEGLPSTSEAWCYLAMSRVMVRRLAGVVRPERRRGRLRTPGQRQEGRSYWPQHQVGGS